MSNRTAMTMVLQRVVAVCAVCAAVVSMVMVPHATAAGKPTGKLANPWASQGLEVVGELDNPWQKDLGSLGRAALDFIDEEKRLGYGILFGGRLAVYDLRTAVPTPLRISEASVSHGIGSSYTMTIDRARNRLFMVGKSPSSENRSMIEVIDLTTLAKVATWDLASTVPGYVAYGFTYEKATDRLLLVGDFTGTVLFNSISDSAGTKAVSPGGAVVALSAATGALEWVAPMRKCHRVASNGAVGGLIARSNYRPAVYVMCISGRAASQAVGQNGLVRLDITNEKTAKGVVEFPAEFFPVSGDYSGQPEASGLAAFDPVAERFFAQSLARRTPGAWVFDGLRDSWVGFIAAPDNTNFRFGLNPANGRYYQVANDPTGFNTNNGYITVTDSRATPVPQGTVFEGLFFNGPVVVDPATSRLFVQVNVPDPSGTPRLTTAVLRDRTESIDPLEPLDLDTFTRDLPDDKALLQYSAGASGFGARYTMVGGWETIWERIGFPGFQTIDNPAGPNPGDLAYGDRGLTFSAVPSVDIRPAGASATAAAGTIDQATQSDRKDTETQAGHEVPVTTLAGGQTCLNGGGKAVRKTQGERDPEFVEVVCDLKKLSASGFASYADDVRGGGHALGGSSLSTRTFRDPKRGVVSETTAVARGLSVRDPSGRGSISIKRITAVSTTVANGRPGTTKATWTRSVEGVVITDNGAEQKPRSCTTTVIAGKTTNSKSDCAELQRAINSVVPSVQVRFPAPSATATRRGAYARIEEPDTDYLNGLSLNNDQSRAVPAMELTIYNDGPEKGRLLAQFAAIDANSIFTRSALFLGGPFDPGNTVGGTDTSGSTGGNDQTASSGQTGGTTSKTTTVTGASGAGLGDGGDLAAGDGSALAPAAAIADGVVTGPAGSALPPVVGWLIGARSPREAAFAIGTWLLFAGALTSVWRRRRLIETVGN